MDGTGGRDLVQSQMLMHNIHCVFTYICLYEAAGGEVLMTGLFLIVLLLVVILVIISKGFIRFSNIFSRQMTFLIIGIYVLLGFSSFVYLVLAKNQHIELMPKAIEDERFQHNEQIHAHLREEKLNQINSS